MHASQGSWIFRTLNTDPSKGTLGSQYLLVEALQRQPGLVQCTEMHQHPGLRGKLRWCVRAFLYGTVWTSSLFSVLWNVTYTVAAGDVGWNICMYANGFLCTAAFHPLLAFALLVSVLGYVLLLCPITIHLHTHAYTARLMCSASPRFHVHVSAHVVYARTRNLTHTLTLHL